MGMCHFLVRSAGVQLGTRGEEVVGGGVTRMNASRNFSRKNENVHLFDK